MLRDVPGVAVSRTGAVGSFTQVRIRGTEGNHVLTLIDGIKASDPFLGEFDYATLLADDVARVEVLRGQQSAHLRLRRDRRRDQLHHADRP